MPTSYIPAITRRYSYPSFYKVKNIAEHHFNNSTTCLPSLQATTNNKMLERHHQFSDVSCQEKSSMIDKLIEASADIIDSIWSNSRCNDTCNAMPLAKFIREILKRSQATYSILQLALFYIFRIKKQIHERTSQHYENKKHYTTWLVCCSRRMFLVSLLVASKYLNDKSYRNKAWANIVCLSTQEINAVEVVFLKLIDYKLFVSKPVYDKWVSLLHEYIQKKGFVQIKQFQLAKDELCCRTTFEVCLTQKSPYCTFSETNGYFESDSGSSISNSSQESTPNDLQALTSALSDTPSLICGSKRSYLFPTNGAAHIKRPRQL